MLSRKEISLVAAGILAGIAVSNPVTQAAAGLMANPSNQNFYLDGQRISLTAYEIGGSNYVKLRDIGKVVNFGITYDAATNTVTIYPDMPYETASTAPASNQATLSKNVDGSINIPQDGSQYIPQAGDVIRCNDGTNYTITDVSRYDKNYFADGPVGPLPIATCDWSQFDQPELPKAEVRRFNNPDGDYIFIRNLVRNPPDALQPLQCHGRRRVDHAERNTENAGRWNALGTHPSDPAGRHDLRPLLALARGSSPRSAALLPRR